MTGSDTDTLSCAGVAWYGARSDLDALRPELLERIRDLDGLPGAACVKTTTVRTVYRVALSGGRVVLVKVFRARTWRERMKERWIRNKARAEWIISGRLAAMGIPASRAVALGLPSDTRGEVQGYLVVEAVSPALGLNAFLKGLRAPGAVAPGEIRRCAREIACFVRNFHDAGVAHLDLHAGNILVRPGAADGNRLVLIDLHRVVTGAVPGMRHRAAALARLLRSLPSLGGPDERALFLKDYAGVQSEWCDGVLSPARLEELMDLQNAARLRSRGRRCFRNSSRFVVEYFDEGRLYRLRAYEAGPIFAAIDACLRNSESEPASGVRTCRVPDASREGESLVVKAFPRPHWLRRIASVARYSPAVREYGDTYRRWLCDHSRPQSVAAVEYRRGPRRGMSFAVTEEP